MGTTNNATKLVRLMLADFAVISHARMLSQGGKN